MKMTREHAGEAIPHLKQRRMSIRMRRQTSSIGGMQLKGAGLGRRAEQAADRVTPPIYLPTGLPIGR